MGARVVSLLVLFLGTSAQADEVKQAQGLYEEGMKNYNVGEYRRALDSFKAGYYAKADPAFLFNMAQCFRMLGEAEPAIREYRAYLRARSDAPNREAVERFIDDLEQELKRKTADKPPLGTVAPAVAAQPSPSPQPSSNPVTSIPAREAPVAARPPAPSPTPNPAVVTAIAPPNPEAARATTPVYKKGWFWGVMAGALVVVGGGVALAIAETSPANASPTGDFAPAMVRF